MKKILSIILSTLLITSMASTVFAEDTTSTLESTFDIKHIELLENTSFLGYTEDAYQINQWTENDTWGKTFLKDYEGNNIVKEDFANIGFFSYGVAPAQKYIGSKWGYINKEGNWVIDPIFDFADTFADGVALISIGGTYGYINTEGKVVYKVEDANFGTRFYDGYAIISKGDSSTIIDNKFNEVSVVDGFIYNTNFKDKRFILTRWNEPENVEELPEEYNIDLYTTTEIVDIDGHVYFSENNVSATDFVDGKTMIKDNNTNTLKLIDINGTVVAEKTDIPENVYYQYVCDNVIIENTYGEDGTSTLNILNENFENLKTYTGYYGFVNASLESLYVMNDDMDDVYVYLNKNYKETEIEPVKYDKFYEIAQGTIDDSVLVLKINDSRAYVDGEMRWIDSEINKSNPPTTFIKDGRTLIPLRFISENFANGSFNVDYKEKDGEQIITISGDKQIELVIGKNTASVTTYNFETKKYETEEYVLDVAPIISHDRTYVPVRFVSEIMGYNVEWDDNGYVIIGNKDLLSDTVDNIFDSVLTLENYPRIDGSTATLPLSYALTSKMLNIEDWEAMRITHHNKTETAFNNFVNGTADILLTGTPNDKKIKKAQDAGIDIAYHPFAKDAFVFIVSKDNPVDSLTTQQVKDIYSGKITNWKEVGGNDAEIEAFQRNEDSGSQNLMKKFMGDTPLMTPKMEKINAMGEMIDLIAEYDNNVNSIGYTVNYYFSEMYSSDNVKVIKLDGVEPNETNIKNGTYPQTLEYSIIYNNKESEPSPVKTIVNFLKSEDGKTMVKNANFIALD